MTEQRAFDFSGYQEAAARTGGLVATDHPIVYPTLGLVNEAGEVAGKVKKIFRDRAGVITDADREALTLELGDVLWYLSELSTRLGIRLEDVAERNLAKLADRASRGVLQGDGDHR
ncbi:MAG TPA: nucleoside triphosphate pyrophosphohydrolase family protein [Kribbella sp.]